MIRGGLFAGFLVLVVNLKFSNEGYIALTKLNNSSRLVTIILSKVKRGLYNEVLEKLTEKKRKKKP